MTLAWLRKNLLVWSMYKLGSLYSNFFLIWFFTSFDIFLREIWKLLEIWLIRRGNCAYQENLHWHGEEPNVAKQLILRFFTSWYILHISCFLDLIQVPRNLLCLLFLVFLFWLLWYLKLEILSTWSSNIQLK